MPSAKLDSSVINMTRLLRTWDRAAKGKRRQLLQEFIDQHQNRSGPELESEMAQMASLFLARICVWTKLTQDYLREFLEHGGLLCLHELCLSNQSREIDKQWALKVLVCIAKSGTKFKETICECYGIRAAAECMAKSRSEETQETARRLLELLASSNPRFSDHVYKGLIGVLPCHSPKAQQLALQTLRVLQQRRTSANRALIDRIIYLLESLHLEVQSAVIELVCDLMRFDLADDILSSLVSLLRPQREIQLGKLIAAADSVEDSEEGEGSSGESDSGNEESRTHRSGGKKSLSGTRRRRKVKSISSTSSYTRRRRHQRRHQQHHSQSSTNTSITEGASPISTIAKARSQSRQNHVAGGGGKLVKLPAEGGGEGQRKSRGRRRKDDTSTPLLVFVQQASAIKCLRILCEDSASVTKRLLKMNILSGLLYALGNLEHPESQRQASLTLQYLCKFHQKIDTVVHESMGPTLYTDFVQEPDSHYLQITPLQADILISNKVSYLGASRLVSHIESIQFVTNQLYHVSDQYHVLTSPSQRAQFARSSSDSYFLFIHT